jgi:hypothetical protein
MENRFLTVKKQGVVVVALSAALLAIHGYHGPAAARPVPPAAKRAPGPRKAESEGTLDKTVIRAGIQQIMSEIETCYKNSLAKTPGLGGRLVVKFKIRAQGGKGVVGEGEIQPDSDAAMLATPETGQCILNALATAEFPAPKGGNEVTVSYPLLFSTDPLKDH